jgi:CRP-like cAMP-binding protein
MSSRSRDPKIGIISSLDLFRSCNRHQLQVVSALCDRLELSAGAVLARQAERTLQCIVIVSGSASAAIDGEPVGTVVLGSLLGHRSILYREPSVATVTTTSTTQILVFPLREFLTLAVGDPTIAPAVGERAQSPDPLLHPAVGDQVLALT